MLTLEELAVCLAYDLEREKGHHQRQVEQHKAKLAARGQQIQKLMAHCTRVQADRVHLVAQAQAGTATKIAALTAKVDELTIALRKRNAEVREADDLRMRLTSSAGFGTTYERLYRQARADAELYRGKFSALLAELENLREMGPVE